MISHELNGDSRVDFLFPSPVFVTSVRNHEKIREEFLPILDEAPEDFFHNPWKACEVKTTHEHPSNEVLPWSTAMEGIVPSISEMITSYGGSDESESQYVVANAWVNKYDKGCWQESHSHLSAKMNVIFSFVYFLQQSSGSEEESGGVFMMEGSSALFDTVVDLDLPMLGRSNKAVYHGKEVEGKIIVFPANQVHMVSPVKNDETRYSISGNILRINREI